MTLNETQIAALRAFIRGEPVDTVHSGSLGSMYTAKCDICGLFKTYPLIVGVGAAVQVWNEREKYVFLCGPCEEALKEEHFRRTAYFEIFKPRGWDRSEIDALRDELDRVKRERDEALGRIGNALA